MSRTTGAAAAETTTRRLASFREIADFLWQNAERMRGAHKPNEYDKVILPLLVARRPDTVPNHVMGSVFEELIRRFNEKKNEEAGDHYTPREIIRLTVDLLFVEGDQALRRAGIVRTLFDPTCGTGGMLSVAEEYLRDAQPRLASRGVRPGSEPGVLRDLQERHGVLARDWSCRSSRSRRRS